MQTELTAKQMSIVSFGDYGLNYCLAWESFAALNVLRKGMTHEDIIAALAGHGCKTALDKLSFCEPATEHMCTEPTSKRIMESSEVDACFPLSEPALKRYKNDLTPHYCKDPDNMLKYTS